MYLTELFTQATQWEYKINQPDKIVASFKIDPYIYRVYMNKDLGRLAPPAIELGGPTETFEEIWSVTFSVSDPSLPGSEGMEMDDITDTGNAIAVFSTVIDIIETTVEQYNIPNLYFTSEEPSRTKLYNRMSKQFTKKGWRYIDHKEINARSSGPDTQGVHLFLLTKQPHPHSLMRGTKAHD